MHGHPVSRTFYQGLALADNSKLASSLTAKTGTALSLLWIVKLNFFSVCDCDLLALCVIINNNN